MYHFRTDSYDDFWSALTSSASIITTEEEKRGGIYRRTREEVNCVMLYNVGSLVMRGTSTYIVHINNINNSQYLHK